MLLNSLLTIAWLFIVAVVLLALAPALVGTYEKIRYKKPTLRELLAKTPRQD